VVDLPPAVLAVVQAAVCRVGGLPLPEDDVEDGGDSDDAVVDASKKDKKRDKKAKKDKKKSKKKKRGDDSDEDDGGNEAEGAVDADRSRKRLRGGAGDSSAGAGPAIGQGFGVAPDDLGDHVLVLLTASELLRLRTLWVRTPPPQLTWPSRDTDLALVTPESVLGALPSPVLLLSQGHARTHPMDTFSHFLWSTCLEACC
jgi:hypothetical protein